MARVAAAAGVRRVQHRGHHRAEQGPSCSCGSATAEHRAAPPACTSISWSTDDSAGQARLDTATTSPHRPGHRVNRRSRAGRGQRDHLRRRRPAGRREKSIGSAGSWLPPQRERRAGRAAHGRTGDGPIDSADRPIGPQEQRRGRDQDAVDDQVVRTRRGGHRTGSPTATASNADHPTGNRPAIAARIAGRTWSNLGLRGRCSPCSTRSPRAPSGTPPADLISSQDRHQPGEHRPDAVAGLRSGGARLPRHHPGRPPGRTAPGRLAVAVPDPRGHPRPRERSTSGRWPRASSGSGPPETLPPGPRGEAHL